QRGRGRESDLAEVLGGNARTRAVAAVEPRRRLQPLERLARLLEKRAGIVGPALGEQPFAVLELDDGEVEHEPVLAEDGLRRLERLLRLRVTAARTQEPAKPRGLRQQERGLDAGRNRVDALHEAVRALELIERERRLERLCQGDLGIDGDTCAEALGGDDRLLRGNERLLDAAL